MPRSLTSSQPLRARVAGLAAVTLAGCVPALPHGAAPPPDTRVPDAYGDVAYDESSAALDWRALFDDPALVALIDGALRHNQELNIQVQEVLVAQNEVRARAGEIWPSVTAGAGAGVEHVGETTSQGRADEATGVPRNLMDYRFGLFASWEIDVWKKLRNTRDAAVFRYLASIEGRNFMVTRLVAETARLYYELLSLDRQLAVLDDSIELQRSALEVVRLQQQAARVTMLAVARFEAQLRNFESRRSDILQRRVETESQLNFLAGRFPQPVERSPTRFFEASPLAIQVGRPAMLLENRPDVRQAELELSAASLDVDVARARFYPTLSIEAGVGYESYDLRRLVATPESVLYNLFANVMAPLLNRAGITADYYSANSREVQAVIRYERTILQASMDVYNTLQLVKNMEQKYSLKQRQVDRLRESIEISNLLFQSARADYLEVLTTRRDALDAEMELVETRQRQLASAVLLYQALGGGWRSYDEVAAEDAGGGSR